MTKYQEAVTAIIAELGKTEMVLADPLTLDRLKAQRILTAVLQVLREPDARMVSAGAEAIWQSADACSGWDGDGAWLSVHDEGPRNVLQAMLDAVGEGR